MGKWLAKFSTDIPESRTAIADIVPLDPALSALSVPHLGGPAKTPGLPPLQPGWRIAYRDHQWRLAGGSEDPDHGTVDVCRWEGGVWMVRLTDGQQIPLNRVRAVGAVDHTGRCYGAWTVREHGYDGQGPLAKGLPTRDHRLPPRGPVEHPAAPTPRLFVKAPGPVCATNVDWLAAWQALAALTAGITTEDPRFAGVMAALDQCDEAYRGENRVAFRHAAEHLQRVLADS